MENRRNTHGFADFGKSGSAECSSGIRCQKTFHGTGNGITSCGQNQYVIFDQFFNNCKMAFIVFCSGIVTSDNTGYTTDTAIDDIVVQCVVGTAEGAAQVIFDGFNTEPCNLGCFNIWYHDFFFTVFKVFNRKRHDPDGIFHCMVLVEFNVNDIVLIHLPHGVGGDQLGMTAFSHIGKVLEDTLNIHHHGVTGACHNGKFLLEECSCRGNPVSLEHFIGRTADTTQLNAFCTDFVRQFKHFSTLGCCNDHFGKYGLMAVNNNVDMIFFHDAQVGFGDQGRRGTEHDVLKIGCNHGPAPAISQCASCALFHQVFIILVNPHVGPVHDINDFSVY